MREPILSRVAFGQYVCRPPDYASDSHLRGVSFVGITYTVVSVFFVRYGLPRRGRLVSSPLSFPWLGHASVCGCLGGRVVVVSKVILVLLLLYLVSTRNLILLVTALSVGVGLSDLLLERGTALGVYGHLVGNVLAWVRVKYRLVSGAR